MSKEYKKSLSKVLEAKSIIEKELDSINDDIKKLLKLDKSISMQVPTMEIDYNYLNKNFRITFDPIPEKVKPYLLKRKRRATISFQKLPELIGIERTEFIVKKILKLKLDKKRFRVQNKGIIDVYCV